MRPEDKRYILISITLIVALGFVVYASSFGGQFILDDRHLVKDNRYIKDASNIDRIFTENIMAGSGRETDFYRPLQVCTYMVDYFLWGLDVNGYHITNTLLHILAALALYWLIALLCDDKRLPFLTAILFVVHPVHTGAVAYISGRADSLAAIFILVSLALYIKSLSSRGIHIYLGAVVSYALALLSKEYVLVMPLLLLLYHYAFKKKIDLKRFLPVIGLAAFYIFLRFTLLRGMQSGDSSQTAFLERLPGFFVAIATYARILILPFDLHMEYGNLVFTLADPRTFAGIILLFFPLVYSFKKRDAYPQNFFFIWWFFLLILPVSNLYPINAYMAEHWLYLPSAGYFFMLARALVWLKDKKGFGKIVPALSICLVAFYSYLAIEQNNYWKEPVSFYERTLRYSKNERIYNNLGNLYTDMGKPKEAIAVYKRAIEIDPLAKDAYSNLGVLYSKIGNKKAAINSFNKAIELDPGFVPAYINLALEHNSIGEKKEAISLLEKAVKIDPRYAIAHNNLSVIYYDQGRYDKAVKHSDIAASLGYDVLPQFLRLLEPYRNQR